MPNQLSVVTLKSWSIRPSSSVAHPVSSRVGVTLFASTQSGQSRQSAHWFKSQDIDAYAIGTAITGSRIDHQLHTSRVLVKQLADSESDDGSLW